MRSRLFGVVVLFACRHEDAPKSAPVADSGREVLLDASIVADANVDAPVAPEAVIARWNDAHTKHDTAELESMYGDSVFFYGLLLSRSECVKRKAGALAKSADYSQVVRDLHVERHDKDRMWVATFTKVSTSQGKATSYLTTMTIDEHGLITAENDTPDYDRGWCMDRDGQTDKIIAPFKVSAKAAESRLIHSKYAHDLYVHDAKAVGTVSALFYSCPNPAQCIPGGLGPPTSEDELRPGPGHMCFYFARLDVYDPRFAAAGGSSVVHLSGGEYIDAITGTIWYRASLPTGPGWQSER
jgi:hypothetical protein